MNPALTSYVLVDEANQPVPLPFHTSDGQCIVNFDPPHHANSSGRVIVMSEGGHSTTQYFPHIFNLHIITENEYMATQAGRQPFHLIDPASGTSIPLPHYLPDDQTVTSVDARHLVCETTRSITWLDPAKYGLSIIADCDLQVTV